MKIKTGASCICGLSTVYVNCCGRYLDMGQVPENAEELMRSRYSAYTLCREDYLLETWHPETRPLSLELTSRQKWLNLSVKQHKQLSPKLALVEFIARYKIAGRAYRLHEISRFVFEKERWFYVDGDFVKKP
ncbi:YchJ family protein [Nitrosomonas marina]|uniref:SEC-C motif-containing protein n=1 Tax=Nitrosomonas marina TaxID=917 RepID=A0A1H8B339_9PROT|nr:YchJ family metal-binding protein [Nitrosomonas marina]SEM76237.1 SEC-C motif-containing protein [Nitrosomonas marina]